ncbi:DNA repair protein XRCC1 [Pimephales promelas]|uniref:DNA repair protein XRCC1 n=1 Tax=Pimephales promelas TaxID=90988 RepID=UPI001955520B|nr:DNA repair protein XRCC1 [Pimephales promelas]KAG1932366.1 BRCT domain-containing DNA repair protein [Pimephales promelas]
MPEIKLKHIVSCSSEDNTHKADNLLSSDTYRKWKAARPGEKQVSVILQLEKEEQIHSIDIGNEGSAFIEVLVGHSTSVKDQDFEVLLVTSSFMSPTESRNGSNTNRVRFFGPNQLVKATAQEKWDRVKVVCSQPYSKSIAYGITFIKLHSPPDGNDVPITTPPKLTKLGQFRVKDESPSSGSNIQPGSLFFSRESTAKSSTGLKVSPQNERLSYATAALKSDASSTQTSSSSTSTQQAPVKRKFEFSKERLEATGPPPKKPSSSASSEPNSATPKSKARTSATASPITTGQKTPDKRESPKSKPEPKPKPKPKPKSAEPVAFNRILEGVVFVLSGFQNPFRGELRDKALAMGGRYKPDWTPDSTHLICAFANTPKYSQVKAAGGIIVRKEWVMDCYKTKQKISFKRYLMDGAESSSESEDEQDESEEEAQKTKTPEKRHVTPKKQPIKEEEEYGGSTDAEGPEDDASGMDTEDELNRVEMESRKKKAAKASPAKVKDEDLYGGSTDENTDAEEDEDIPIPELPDFLKGKRFYLYGKFPDNQKRQLQRYIIAFNGAVEDYMSEKVQFVITSEGWDESFEDALMENGSLSFVKPSWIFAINDRQKMLPYQPYTVVP